MKKLSLGAGTEIEQGADWINVDIVKLPGINKVMNVMSFPWPFEDNSVEYIKAKDLLEHLDHYSNVKDTNGKRPTIVMFMEEVARILKPGGVLWIQTPSWQADFLWIDPTHVRGFDIRSMDFFDPETDFGRSGGFISKARFKVTATELENKNLQFTMVKI